MQRSSLQEFHKEVTQRLSKLTAWSQGRQVGRKDYQKTTASKANVNVGLTHFFLSA